MCTVLLYTCLCTVVRAASEEVRTAPVGMLSRIDQIILPGSELEAKPLEDEKAPVVLRVAGVFSHGSDFRYDLVYYGLEPGEHDLRDYLRRRDGSKMDDVPKLLVKITTELPPGQVEPNELQGVKTGYSMHYKLLWGVGGVVWVLGFLAILFVGRRRKRQFEALHKTPLTLAERLRPMMERAARDELSQRELAELERALLAYWRRRLELNKMKADEAMVVMRQHEEAGPLLKQLERWLHQPNRQGGGLDQAELARWLEPYQQLPADALGELEVDE